MLGLSILELHLFVAVLHLHGRHLQGSANSGGSSGSGGGGSVGTSGSSNSSTVASSATAGKSGGDSGVAAMVVGQALTVCDMLVEMFKQKV